LVKVSKATALARQRKWRRGKRSRLVRAQALSVPYGMPQKFTNRLVYDAGSFQIAGASTNGYGEVVFKLNNIYDPDYSNSGYNQSVPLFDDLTSLYDKWRVTKVKVMMTCSNSNTALCDVGVYASLDTTSVFNSSYFSLLNAPKGQYSHMMLGPYQSGADVNSLSYTFDLPKIFGRAVLTDEGYVGTGTTAPTLQLYLHVGGRNKFNLSTGSLAFTCALQLEYTVEWTQPINGMIQED